MWPDHVSRGTTYTALERRPALERVLTEREPMSHSTNPPSYQLYVGIDIAATTFTAVPTTDGPPHERARTFAQTPQGFAALHDQLRATTVAPAQTLIVVEATGSYWVALAVYLHEAGYVVSVVNPAHAHYFAQSLPRRAKTDLLDAPVLAQFAAERKPAPWTPPPQVYHELRQRLLARDGLLEMRQQARNQLHALLQWPVVIASVRQQLDSLIVDLDSRLAELEAEIAQVLEDGAWAESASLLLSITGIGLITTAWLLVGTELPGLRLGLLCQRIRGPGATGARVGQQCARTGPDWAWWTRTLAYGTLSGHADGGALQSGDQGAL